MHLQSPHLNQSFCLPAPTSRKEILHNQLILLSRSISVVVLFFQALPVSFFSLSLWTHVQISSPNMLLSVHSCFSCLQSISTSCSSTYCNGHIYTRKWSGLQPWEQVALQKSVCLSLPSWTFSPKIRIVSSCHLSHASPSPKPHRLYLVHSVFFTRFSISTIAYIIIFTHVVFYCLLHECQPYGLILSPCVNSGRNAIVATSWKERLLPS